VSLLRNDKLVISNVHIGRNCGDRPVLSALRIAEPTDGGNPGLEVCTAETYGAEGRCFPFRFLEMNKAIDNGTIAEHARRP
jgi:hypothetical protein